MTKIYKVRARINWVQEYAIAAESQAEAEDQVYEALMASPVDPGDGSVEIYTLDELQS